MRFTRREKYIMREAFIMGRLYMANGEREGADEIHDLVEFQCEQAVRRRSRQDGVRSPGFLRRLLWAA